VATPRRGAAVVTFDVRRIRSVSGRVALADGTATGVGELRVEGDPRATAPLGGDGRFHLVVAAGARHAVVLEHAQGVCRFALDVPPTSAATVDVGTVQCVADGATSGPALASGPPSASTVTNRVPAIAIAAGN
jgi:outer membrane usher protein FimD/PapC